MSMEPETPDEIKNAIIKSTFLGLEDHGMFIFGLELEYANGNQMAGTYRLDYYNAKKDVSMSQPYAIPLLTRIIEICGAEKWEDLTGEMIRVKATQTEVLAIGHIIREEWLVFKEFVKKYGSM